MFHITRYLVVELVVLAGFGLGIAIFYWMRGRRRQRARRLAVAGGAAPLREVIDRKRPTTLEVLPIPEKKKATLREAIFSRRRMRALLLVAVAFVLLGGFGVAAYLNSGYRTQTYAKKTVARMASAPSYRAVGRDTENDVNTVKEVLEQFLYVAPDSVWTHYRTTARRPGMEGTVAIDCADKEIVVVGSTRYQRCNDAGSSTKGWVVDSFDTNVLHSELFQPWVRFLWCLKVNEQDATEEIKGVVNQVFTCRVRNEQEATTIWQRKAGENKLDGKSEAARQRFLTETVVDITVWVRETDGYIGRFAMTKTSPGTLGPKTETVDYVYSEFGEIAPIAAPANETPQEDQASGNATSQVRYRTATINGQRFNIEVADDDAKRTSGFSKRAIIPDNSGMLFVFPKEDSWKFWMKDVLVPLDAIYMDRRGTIVDIITMPTQPGVPDSMLRVYTPSAPALYVLEVNASLADKYGFEVGMVVGLQ